MDEKNKKNKNKLNEQANEQMDVNTRRCKQKYNDRISSIDGYICERNDSKEQKKAGKNTQNSQRYHIRLRHHIMACLTLLWPLARLCTHTGTHSIIIIVAVGDK